MPHADVLTTISSKETKINQNYKKVYLYEVVFIFQGLLVRRTVSQNALCTNFILQVIQFYHDRPFKNTYEYLHLLYNDQNKTTKFKCFYKHS